MDEKQFFDKARKVAKDIDQGTYMKMENPYELADELLAGGEWSMRAQAMIRYQADRIAELERKLKEEFDYAEKLLKERGQ